jgi:uncharacterized protein (DUF433 family)
MILRFKTLEEFSRYKEAWAMKREQHEFLFLLFEEVSDFIESPFTPRFDDVHFEKIPYEGPPESLLFLFDLEKHRTAYDMDVVYVRSTRHEIKTGKAASYGSVEVAISTKERPALEAILQAMNETWPDEFNEWTRIKTALNKYSSGDITRAEAMSELGLETTQLEAFNDMMFRYHVHWPEPDRTKAEKEGEIVAAAIADNRIETDPTVMGGKPVFKGTRIPVELIVTKLADGMTEQELLEAYPNLSKADIEAAAQFAKEHE